MRSGLVAVRVLGAGVATRPVVVTEIPLRPWLDGFTTSRTGRKPGSDDGDEAPANPPMRPGVVLALP